MKRFGNLYSKVYDMENLRLAHKNAKRGKGWYQEIKEVEADLDNYLLKLQQMLINKTYKTSEYETFTKKERDKEREIFKLPYFPDRICQWAIMQVIEPYLMRNLTAHTYSAIKGRGIHYGMKRVRKDLKYHKEECKYCLKIDIKKYYPSINHEILKQKYRKLFKDKDLLWLIDEIIDSTEGDTGIPIGNYLSQWSGNLYLSDLDHWLKEVKKVKCCHRYMDDIVIFSSNKEYLHKLRLDLQNYLATTLKLEMKSNYQIFPTYIRGLDFLGFRFFNKFILLRKNTYKQFKRTIAAIHSRLKLDLGINLHYWCAYNSYKGWIIPCNHYRLAKKYLEPLQKIMDSFYLTNIKGGN